MSRARVSRRWCALSVGLLAAAAWARPDNPRVWTDPAGDATIRRSDPAMAGQLGPGCTIPDLLKLSIGGWEATAPASDPYTGHFDNPESANLFRLDLEVKGLVCPPGPAALSSYNPFLFGTSPLYGFVELDIDTDRDSGGELGAAAKTKYLANVGRFGTSPRGSIHSRFVASGRDIDSDFYSAPQFERSGADFMLTLCGCYPTTIVTEGGNGNHLFEAGETWIVRSGFFQRAGGYQGVCSSTGGAAGLQPGLYVPYVNLRWSHCISTDTTTITLVYSLNQSGAAQLAGQPVQPINLNVSDHTSIAEALSDLVQGAPSASSGSPVWYLSRHWAFQDPTDPDTLNPTRWNATALIGTAYENPVDGAVFAWTDTGFGECPLDMDGDGVADQTDRQLVKDRIDDLDGSIWDADGQASENGGVTLIDPGVNFEVADVDGSGAINRFDTAAYCPPDFSRDGVINILDFLAFMNAYAAQDPRADFNHNGIFDVLDFISFMNAVAAGC